MLLKGNKQKMSWEDLCVDREQGRRTNTVVQGKSASPGWRCSEWEGGCCWKESGCCWKERKSGSCWKGMGAAGRGWELLEGGWVLLEGCWVPQPTTMREGQELAHSDAAAHAEVSWVALG